MTSAMHGRETAEPLRWRDGGSTGSTDERDLGSDDVGATAAALERAAGALCARWKPTILLLLASGARRRSALDRSLPATVSQKVLTEQLRGLEADGLVARVDHRALRHAGQRHVTYALTAAGEELAGVVRALARWGTAHHVGAGRPSRQPAMVCAERPVQRTG